jgi:hypothetical protein
MNGRCARRSHRHRVPLDGRDGRRRLETLSGVLGRAHVRVSRVRSRFMCRLSFPRPCKGRRGTVLGLTGCCPMTPSDRQPSAWCHLCTPCGLPRTQEGNVDGPVTTGPPPTPQRPFAQAMHGDPESPVPTRHEPGRIGPTPTGISAEDSREKWPKAAPHLGFPEIRSCTSNPGVASHIAELSALA